jgi:hypothetical protein
MLPALMGLVTVACLYDKGRPCGANQIFTDNQCVCAEGFGLSDGQCVRCGEHAVGSLAGCSCETGYSPATDGGLCTKVSAGQACVSDDDCAGGETPYCHIGANGNYCTVKNCADSQECVGANYACNSDGELAYCQKPPTGFGAACSSVDDCKDFEASYCEQMVNKICMVAGCKENPKNCHGDWPCCDLAAIGTSLCIPPEQLTSGVCPFGGVLIPRGGG